MAEISLLKSNNYQTLPIPNYIKVLKMHYFFPGQSHPAGSNPGLLEKLSSDIFHLINLMFPHTIAFTEKIMPNLPLLANVLAIIINGP